MVNLHTDNMIYKNNSNTLFNAFHAKSVLWPHEKQVLLGRANCYCVIEDQENNSPGFSINPEAFASELLENLEDMAVVSGSDINSCERC